MSRKDLPSPSTRLILLYWSIGRDILARQTAEGWGAGVIARLATGLRRDFPEMTGLSSQNLNYMRAFAEAYLTPQSCNRLLHDCGGEALRQKPPGGWVARAWAGRAFAAELDAIGWTRARSPACPGHSRLP